MSVSKSCRTSAPDVATADNRGEPFEVDPVRAGHEDDDRLELGFVAGVHEDQGLDDLANLRAHDARRIGRGMGGVGKGHDLEGHALADVAL